MNRPSPASRILPHQIGFDFDGVIADTGEAFLRLACEEYGYCSFTIDDITEFELEGCIDMPRELVASIFNDILTDSLKTGLRPMDGAMDVLGELAAHSPITIITARPLEQPVLDWLDGHYPGDVEQSFNLIAMGDHDEKLKYIRDRKLQYFVDDRAETCRMLAAGDITPLVFSHPWNRNRHNLTEVNSWQEIRSLLHLPQYDTVT